MKHLWTVALLAPFSAFAQSIDLEWPNMPCAALLHCDSGCTACNMATNSSALFNGTGLAHTGVDICPESTGGGDNALATYGWTLGVDSAHALFLTAIALQPVHIDSIIIRHRSSGDGPDHVRVSLGVNNGPIEPFAELTTGGSFADAELHDLGCIAAGPGMAYGFVKIYLQPFGSISGAWYLDEIRIVGTPCASTGINEELTGVEHVQGVPIDLLGRPVGRVAVTGAYLTGRRRVFVP